MNDHEIERIAAAMNMLRPDWPKAQLKTLLKDERITDRPRRDVSVALAWVACEPNCRGWVALVGIAWNTDTTCMPYRTVDRSAPDKKSMVRSCGPQTATANFTHGTGYEPSFTAKT